MGGAAISRWLPCRSPIYRSSFGSVFGNGRARFGQIVAGVGVGEPGVCGGVRGSGVVTDAGRRELADFLVGKDQSCPMMLGFWTMAWRRCRSRSWKVTQFG